MQKFSPPSRGSYLGAKAPSAYAYRGKKYGTEEEFCAALSGGGLGAQPGRQVEMINRCLGDLSELQKKVSGIFREFAGPDQLLQPGECVGLVSSISAELGLSNPTEIFGDAHVMFYRFDFNGSGALGEDECLQMMKYLLRRARDSLSPQGAKTVNLPRKDLHSEFHNLKQLGQGGQGAVYLAEQRGNKKVVKFYDKSNTNAPLDGIVEEFTILQELDHPQIARVLDMFQDATNIYVISEPYFGGDLTDLFINARENGVTPTYTWTFQIFKQILEGVSHLHSRMIIHCDLKEPNIMIASNTDWNKPRVVLIDFGLARECSGEMGTCGTPGYIPPEVWNEGLWTPKGDVFCLAVIFYSILVGQAPFPGWTLQEIEEKTVRQEMDCSMLPGDVQPFLRDMGNKDFRRRPTAMQVVSNPDWVFQKLGEHKEALDPKVLQDLSKAALSSNAQNLLALELTSAENLGQLKELNELFESLDKNNDGIVNADEARSGLAGLGLTADQVERMISNIVGQDGEVRYTEFMTKLCIAHRGAQDFEISKVFKTIDLDGDGTINVKEIEKMLQGKTMARLMAGRTAADLMHEMDQDKDGTISFDEFRLVMQGKRREVWLVGETGTYYSASRRSWLPCRVTYVHRRSGACQIDVKPGYWLSLAEQKTLLQREGASEMWQVGQSASYLSVRQGVRLPCTIIEVDANTGAVRINIKPTYWMPPDEQQKVLFKENVPSA